MKPAKKEPEPLGFTAPELELRPELKDLVDKLGGVFDKKDKPAPLPLQIRHAPGSCCPDMAPNRADGVMAKCKGCSSPLVKSLAYGWVMADWPKKAVK